MNPAEAYAAVLAELKTALADTRLRLATGIPDKIVERRTVIVGPPAFAWNGVCDPNAPDQMTFEVVLVEQRDDRSVETLLSHLPELIEAVQSIGDDCTVTDGPRPAAYPAGSVDLPAYTMTVELGL